MKTELGSYVEWALAELWQEGKWSEEQSPASIFSSLAVPYKVTQANECLFQLLVLDY